MPGPESGVTAVLKPDERRLLGLFQTFGPLKYEQVKRYLGRPLSRNLRGLVRNLKYRGYLTYDPGTFKLIPAGWRGGSNDSVIRAFYIFLEFAAEAEQVCRSSPPGQIFFIREGRPYEIVVVPKGQEPVIMAQLQNIPDTETQYILVLDELGQVNQLLCPRLLAIGTVHAGKTKLYTIHNKNEEEMNHEDKPS